MARGKYRPKVLTWDDILNDEDRFPDSDPDLYHKKILAEGDSWFSLGGIPTSNLLFNLRFNEPTLIVNIAYPGETMVEMTKLSENEQLVDALGPDGLEWDAILFSGGGNDMVDHVDEFLLSRDERGSDAMPSVDEYCSEEKLSELIKNVGNGLRKIIKLRDQEGGSGKGKPIVSYTYAYATPRNSPARFFGLGFRGPWIYPAFVGKEIPRKDWLALSDYLLDRLAASHLAVAGEQKTLHVVDTRKRLNRAALDTVGEDADWLNEFHPNGRGYKKLAKAIGPVLNGLID